MHILQKFKKRKKKGFTLIELMVGIAILGILAFFLAPYFQDMYYESEVTATMNDLTELKKSAINYRVNSKTGQYPDSLTEIANGLTEEQSRSGRAMRFVDKQEWFNNGNVDTTKIVDSWGNPITYTKSTTNGESTLTSTGNGKKELIVKF